MMCSSLSSTALDSLKRLAVFVAAAVVLCTFASAQDAQSPATASPAPPVSAKLSGLAHRVLEAGLKTNALGGSDLKPWHIKVSFQLVQLGATKPVGGTFEEWNAGQYQWRRVYQGAESNMNGAEWSASKIERYQSKPPRGGFERYLLNLRVARPVIDPLYQAANIGQDFELDVKRINTAGLSLNCVLVVDAQRYAPDANPDYLFPTICFDTDHHLRLTSTSDTMVQFDDLQPFEERVVARDVKVIFKGSLIAEMKVSVLEPWAAASVDQVKPAKDAIAEPYTIEPGQPRPESVYEVGASVPLQPNGMPFLGMFPMAILIHKDGSVNARTGEVYVLNQGLRDALVSAVDKWKYKPYLIDGQPVELATTVFYVLDGKPFVPSYERPKDAVPSAPANNSDAPTGSSGPPRRIRH
jgi:hypothetical protein